MPGSDGSISWAHESECIGARGPQPRHPGQSPIVAPSAPETLIRLRWLVLIKLQRSLLYQPKGKYTYVPETSSPLDCSSPSDGMCHVAGAHGIRRRKAGSLPAFDIAA